MIFQLVLQLQTKSLYKKHYFSLVKLLITWKIGAIIDGWHHEYPMEIELGALGCISY
jgi:hypothetical protein